MALHVHIHRPTRDGNIGPARAHAVGEEFAREEGMKELQDWLRKMKANQEERSIALEAFKKERSKLMKGR